MITRMMMWRLLVVVCSAFVVVGSHAADQVIKIGALFPLSGPNAQFGISSRNGTQMAVDEFNASGGVKSLGGAKIQLVVADAPNPGAATAAVQRLISEEKVVGVVGAFVSSITIAASEVTERASIPFLTHSFADGIVARGYKYIFQVSPKGSSIGKAQFEYAIQLAKLAGDPVSKIAIMYEDTAYGTAQAKGLRDTAKAMNVQIVMDEAYPLGITDVTPLINKLRASGAQMAFPVSYLNDSLLIIRSMRQQKIDIPTVGGAAGYIIPDFKKGLGEFSEGVFSVAPANYDFSLDLNDRYKKRFSSSFIPHEAIMYGGAVEHLMKAIDVAKSVDPSKIRDAVSALKYCQGFAKAFPGGCIAFDDTGANTSIFPLMVEWRGNELNTVFPPQAAKSKATWKGKTLP